MTNRRRFLTHSASAAACVFLPAGAWASKQPSAHTAQGQFTSLIGQSFRGIDETDVGLAFVLVDVEHGTRIEGQENFTLVFKQTSRVKRGRSAGLLRLFNPDMGSTLMHLESSVRGAGVYTADFGIVA